MASFKSSSTKPWQTANWKRKREEYLKGKSCSKCGANENLVIHHLHNIPGFKIQFNFIRSQLIKELVDKKKLKSEKSNGCPNCKYRSIYKRKTVSPLYKCQKCGYEFDKPKKVPTYRLERETYLKFIEEYGPIIEDMVKSQRDDFFQNEYLEFKDCIVLCNKCHLLTHKGMDLCPKCKKAKKIGRELCWNCFIQTPKGQAYLKEKEEEEQFIKEMEEEEEAFFEMSDRYYELEAQGKPEEAKKLLEEWEKKHNYDEEEDESD